MGSLLSKRFVAFREKEKSYFKSQASLTFVNEAIKTILIIVLCFVAVVTIISVASKDPISALKAFFFGPFTDTYSIEQISEEALPLIFTGVAVCIMNKAGQCNMFVEGGFFLGAFLSAWLAPELAGWPSALIPLICIVTSALASGLIGYLPAKMKSSLHISEFVTSLMFNYIVFWVVMFLLHDFASDPDVANKTKYLESFMKLPVLDEDTGFSIAIFVAIVVAVLGWVFIGKTVWGYRLRMTGDNEEFARYSGINTGRVIVSSQVIGAVIAGIGGAGLMLGGSRYYRFEWSSLPNYGFDGFVIAIMANNNPILSIFASFFLGYLRVGASKMSVLSDVPDQVVYIIQALIIIFFGAKLAIRFVKRRKQKASKKEVTP